MRPEEQLERILDETHAVILHAGFASLEDLGLRTDACLALIGAAPDAAILHRVRQKAERNARCLLAAGRGLRAARQRLEEVTAAERGLSTYDGQGRKSGIGMVGQHRRRV